MTPDDAEYRRMYWNAWTTDPRWVRRARVQAEGRVASARLGTLLHSMLENLIAALGRLCARRDEALVDVSEEIP